MDTQTKKKSKASADTGRRDTVADTISKCIGQITGTDTVVATEDLKNCFTPKSKSGQLIFICDGMALKGPPPAWQNRHEIRASLRYTALNKKAVKVDFFTMNLLLQSAIKCALQTRPPAESGVRIEHWDQIVRKAGERPWYMKSRKYSCVDSRFQGDLNIAEDGVVTSVAGSAASQALYDRLLKCDIPTASEFQSTSNTHYSRFRQNSKKNGKLQLSKQKSQRFAAGTYGYSHRLLSIEDYLKASWPTDVCKKCAVQGSFEAEGDRTPHAPLYTCMMCQGKKWLGQIQTTLKWAHDTLQMHHCDVKTAQMLIDAEGNAVVSDLDKATFTLQVGEEAVRIRLNRRDEYPNLKEYANTKGKILAHHFDDARNKEHVKYRFTRTGFIKEGGWKTLSLPRQLSRQFESQPHQTCNFEVSAFMASYLMLAGGNTTTGGILAPLNEAIEIAVKSYNTMRSDEWQHADAAATQAPAVFRHYTLNAKTIMVMKRKDWRKRNDYMHAEKPIEYNGVDPFLQPLRSSVSVEAIAEMVNLTHGRLATKPASRKPVRPPHL